MKRIAFICIHNSCRSQIAEALGKHFAFDIFESYSAGTETKPQINRDTVHIMKEIYGIDMEKAQYSKLILDIPELDIVISMGLDDPTGKSDEEFTEIISQIELKIKNLIDRMK